MNSNQKTSDHQQITWTPRTFVNHEGINMNKDKTHILINLPGQTILRVHQNLIKKVLGIEFTPSKAQVTSTSSCEVVLRPKQKAKVG
jgi:hypothetical protein